MPLFYIRKTVKSEGKVHGIFYKPKYKIPHDKITAMEKTIYSASNRILRNTDNDERNEKLCKKTYKYH